MNSLSRRLLISLCLLLALPANAFAINENDYDALVNDTTFYDASYIDCADQPGAAEPGSDNMETIWNNLIAKGLKPFQVAGVMGSMQSESGFDPYIIEGKRGHTTDPRTVPPGRIGWGLVQWTPAAKVMPYINNQPVSSDPSAAIASEISALWAQLTGVGPSSEKGAGDALQNAPTIEEATTAFELKYERHAGPPQPARVTQAKAIFALAQQKGWASAADAGAAPSICGTPVTTGGCTNPFAAGKFSLGRTDDGVDYAVSSPQPLLAICDMTILAADPNTGWNGPFIYAKLNSGPYAGYCWYYAENLDKGDLPKVNGTYKAGDHIATLNPGGWNLEVGFAKANRLAAMSVGEGHYPADSGRVAAKFLRDLGAKTREDPGTPPFYAGGKCP